MIINLIFVMVAFGLNKEVQAVPPVPKVLLVRKDLVGLPALKDLPAHPAHKALKVRLELLALKEPLVLLVRRVPRVRLAPWVHLDLKVQAVLLAHPVPKDQLALLALRALLVLLVRLDLPVSPDRRARPEILLAILPIG